MSISEHNKAWKQRANEKREKQEQSRNIPSRFAGGGTEYNTAKIVSGNTLETGQAGIKYKSPIITSVPSAYDPDVTSTFIDGIGRGKLYVNGVEQDGYVLIINDDHGSFGNALRFDDIIFAGGPVSIPVTGGGSVSCYTAG